MYLITLLGLLPPTNFFKNGPAKDATSNAGNAPPLCFFIYFTTNYFF